MKSSPPCYPAWLPQGAGSFCSRWWPQIPFTSLSFLVIGPSSLHLLLQKEKLLISVWVEESFSLSRAELASPGSLVPAGEGFFSVLHLCILPNLCSTPFRVCDVCIHLCMHAYTYSTLVCMQGLAVDVDAFFSPSPLCLLKRVSNWTQIVSVKSTNSPACCRDSTIFASQTLEFQADCNTQPAFTWVLEILTLVLTLAWQILYPLNHSSSLPISFVLILSPMVATLLLSAAWITLKVL